MYPNARKMPIETDLYPECVERKPIVVAVIDTGFGLGWPGERSAKLCKYGHKDFTYGFRSYKFGTTDPIPLDNHGHGTHIAGIIDSFAKQTNRSYCIVIIKYYDELNSGGRNYDNTIAAINYARKIKADIINYSGGGVMAQMDEINAVKSFLDQGGIFVAAAGNERSDMAFSKYYPAQDDDRVIVVGNGKSNEDHSETSNYGARVNIWEPGDTVEVYGHYMTGSSQSAAVASGKIIAEKNKTCK